jgi:hypothetical protein
MNRREFIGRAVGAVAATTLSRVLAANGSSQLYFYEEIKTVKGGKSNLFTWLGKKKRDRP